MNTVSRAISRGACAVGFLLVAGCGSSDSTGPGAPADASDSDRSTADAAAQAHDAGVQGPDGTTSPESGAFDAASGDATAVGKSDAALGDGGVAEDASANTTEDAASDAADDAASDAADDAARDAQTGAADATAIDAAPTEDASSSVPDAAADAALDASPGDATVGADGGTTGDTDATSLDASGPSADATVEDAAIEDATTADVSIEDAADALPPDAAPSADAAPDASGSAVAVGIATGGGHSCALLADGTVACWGYNHDGQLGDGYRDFADAGPHLCAVPGQTGYVSCSQTPVRTSNLTGVVSVSAGNANSGAVLADGGVACWGNEWVGQLGNGVAGGLYGSEIPVLTSPMPNGAAAVSLTTGSYFACALLSDATVACWGQNDRGQLGDDQGGVGPATCLGVTNYPCSPSPDAVKASTLSTPVATLGGAVSVSAGNSFACAVRSDQSVWCWGDTADGDLSDAGVLYYTQIQNGSKTAVLVPSVTGATSVAAGSNFACALLTDGSVRCWGVDSTGQLGNPSVPPSSSAYSIAPLAVTGLPATATAITAGADFACALLSTGGVACWGDNTSGELGVADGGPQSCGTHPSNWPCSTHATTIPGITTATAVSAGGAHACALLQGGGVVCWGDNTYGELGNGTQTASATPVNVDFSF